MVWRLIKDKCTFCGRKNGLLTSVHEYGLYGDAGQRINFHEECLELIESNPELHGNRKVDMAIHINELKEKNIKDNASIRDEIIKKYEKLKQCHFERMMPVKGD